MVFKKSKKDKSPQKQKQNNNLYLTGWLKAKQLNQIASSWYRLNSNFYSLNKILSIKSLFERNIILHFSNNNYIMSATIWERILKNSFWKTN